MATPDKANEKDRPIGDAWKDFSDATGKFVDEVRHHSVKNTPAFLVNNSTNLLGASHVLTELMMFKAGLKNGVLVENEKNPILYLYKAFKTVFTDAVKGSRPKDYDFRELFRGNPIKNVYKVITDTGAATEREIALQLKEGKALTEVKLGNPWQTRTTLSGLIVWALSAVIPDKKESDEEVERMAIMQRNNPLGYVAERFRQAVWIPQWPEHKRQMIGLGVMISGVCSTFGAWRQRDKTAAVAKYTFNGSYLATSILTFISSLPLLFASDNARGFGAFGAWMAGRLAFLPTSIYNKFKTKDEGALWYTASTVSFQAENLAQALVGGAEKKPDGTIVDHTAAHKAAQEKAAHIRQQRLFGKVSDKPSTVVANVSQRELAMPEREAELEATIA